MARRSTKTVDTETVAESNGSADDFSFDSVQIAPVAELPKAIHEPRPNPLLQAVRNAVDAGPQSLPVPNGERAKEAENLLRRAATQADVSVKVRFTDTEGKAITPKAAKDSADPVLVYFAVSSEKKERSYTPRAYTAKDIREHFGLDPADKITPEHRREYREAHGLPVRER